jgi:hypothetical protein
MAPRPISPDQIKTPSIKIGIQEGRGGSTPPTPRIWTQTGFPCSARTSNDRGGSPLYSGDNAAHPGPESLTGQRPPRSQRHVPAPRHDHPSMRGSA